MHHVLGIYRNSKEQNTSMGCKGSRVQISALRPVFQLSIRESAQRNGCCDSKEQPDRQNLRGRPPLKLACATRERPKTRHVRPPVGRGNFRPPAVNKKLFAELGESVTQMNEIIRGERAPSREFHVDAIATKALRSKIGLSQPKFAALLHVNVGALRNGEQGLREPTRT